MTIEQIREQVDLLIKLAYNAGKIDGLNEFRDEYKKTVAEEKNNTTSQE